MTHLHSPSTDSPAAQVAAIAFGDHGRRMPNTAALLVEFILAGMIAAADAHRALAVLITDVDTAISKETAAKPDASAAWVDTIEAVNRGH